MVAATAFTQFQNRMSYPEPQRPTVSGGVGQSRLSGILGQNYLRQPTTASGLMDSFGGMFGGGAQGGQGGAGATAAPGPWGTVGAMRVDTPIQPAGIYDPNTLQAARNQIRASVPTALGSQSRNTAAGVSHNPLFNPATGIGPGNLAEVFRGRMGGEDAVQQAMLQARLANAQQLLAGQTAAQQSAMGLAGGQLDRLGQEQRLRYGLAGQDLTRQGAGRDTLMGLLNYL